MMPPALRLCPMDKSRLAVLLGCTQMLGLQS